MLRGSLVPSEPVQALPGGYEGALDWARQSTVSAIAVFRLLSQNLFLVNTLLLYLKLQRSDRHDL